LTTCDDPHRGRRSRRPAVAALRRSAVTAGTRHL